MDPVSAVSGILTIVGAYQTLLNRVRKSSPDPDDATLELEIYGEILSEISNFALQSDSLPKSAQMCMQLCIQRINHVIKQLLGEKHGVLRAALRSHEALESSLNRLKNCIMLLRDIVMDSITHTLLREQREARASGSINGEVAYDVELDDGELTDERLAKIMQSINEGLEFMSEKTVNGRVKIRVGRPGGCSTSETESRKRDIDRFRQEFHAVQARSAANPFTKAVHVVPKDHSRLHEVAMAKFDTQSTPNWINTEIIERLDMMEEIAPYDGPGLSKRHWRAYDSSWLTTKDAPFDLIIGWQLLKEEGIAVFAEPVLAVREMKLTTG
ncbi:hypothetical protein CKM354_000463100 [Cercospora kikuchii]|uniref:Fungal N-terminal domain-containing protein n=1 Tax=Cercospora kikuchii TaxID=84275 RepID=A0A9P3FFY9_9PEZI|nr:uncharacterized protein CKM354_000463100 [Cercospora kikuchii]GIZ41324.1 hypothetical protein CKM354_000463100 [Cercospora kikuchii]